MNNRGFVLVMTMALVLGFTMLGLGAVHLAGNQKIMAEKEDFSTRAFWLAEAGIEKTVAVKKSDQYSVINSACSAWDTCEGGGFSGSLSTGDYEVVVSDAMSTVISTGTLSGIVPPVQRKIKVTLGGVLFRNALFADQTLSLGSNDVVVSGGVGTNGTTADIVKQDQNVQIGGGEYVECNRALPLVYPPSWADYSAATTVNLTNSGPSASISNHHSYKNILVTANDQNATWTINGKVEIFLNSTTEAFGTGAPGNKINIKFDVDSSLTIYTQGKLDFGNFVTIGTTGASGATDTLIVYSTYSGPNGISFMNNGDMNIAVYAPSTDVIIKNNGDVFGAVVGNNITIGNNKTVDFNSGLSLIKDPNGYDIASWEEL